MPWRALLLACSLAWPSCGLAQARAPAAASSDPPAEGRVRLSLTAPPGFPVEAATAQLLLQFRGEAQPGITALRSLDRAHAVWFAPSAVRSLAELLQTAVGVHPRAARLWLATEDLALDRTECLPLQRSSDCVPVRLALLEAGLLELQAGPAQRPTQAPGTGLSMLGSASAALSASRAAGGQASQAASLSTDGRLSWGDASLEYQFNLSAHGLGLPSGGATRAWSNLLLLGFPTPAGTRGHAGLFRSGGVGGPAAAQQFFIHPRMLGLALRAEGQVLQTGVSSEIVVALPTPALVTVSAGGVQVHAGLYGVGEHRIVFDGVNAGFVDVETQDDAGLRQRFQVPATLSDLGTRWLAELGRVVQETSFAAAGQPAAAAQPWLFTAARRFELVRHRVQLGLQATTANGMARIGWSVAPESRRWLLNAVQGRWGESGWHFAAQGLSRGPLQLGWTATRYQPPKAGGGRDPCQAGTVRLCYASQPYARAALSLGVQGWPVSLSYSGTRTNLQPVTRQLLLQSTTALPLPGLAGARLAMTLRRSWPSRDIGLYAHLSIPLDRGATLAFGSLTLGRDGQGSLAAGFNHRFDEPRGWLTSMSHSVQRRLGDARQAAFNHQFAGWAGPLAVQVSASHAPGRFRQATGSATAHYGLSAAGGLALTHPVRGHASPLDPKGMGAVQVVNDSVDPQTVILGQRRFDVPAASRLLVPVPAGYAPELTVSPGPVSDASAGTMPVFLFPGNIQTLRVPDGRWHRVRFVQAGTADTPLQATHTRRAADTAMERLYQDSSGHALLFEPASQEPRIRHIALPAPSGAQQQMLRCTAPAPALPDGTDDLYPETTYECAAEPGLP